jgi:hypothetical protein
MAPFNSSDFQINDVSEASWNVNYHADYLESEVKGAIGLCTVYGAFISIFAEASDDCDYASNKPERNVDRKNVV